MRSGFHKETSGSKGQEATEVSQSENGVPMQEEQAPDSVDRDLPLTQIPPSPDARGETRRELKEALREVVLPAIDLAEGPRSIEDAPKESSAALERATVQAKETAYLNAFRELEAKRTVWNRLMKGKDLNVESAKVEELKREYDEARVVYANALARHVEERVEDRDAHFEERTRAKYEKLKASGLLARKESGEELGFAEFLDRARNRSEGAEDRISSYLRFREVIRPAAQEKIKARREALDSRGTDAIGKVLDWNARYNQKLEKRFGKNGARALKALSGTVLVGLAAAGAGSFGTMSLAAVAGWGTYKFGRAFVGSLIGAAGGELAAGAYEKLFGRRAQEAAKSSLKKVGRSTGTGGLTLEDLQKTDARREKLSVQADERTLAKKKALVKALTAFGIGAGSAAALAELGSVQAAADVAAEGSAPDVPTPPESASASGEAAAPIEQVPVTPEGVLREVDINRGEGFNQLFVDLRASGLEGSSPAIALLLDRDLSATELSARFGAFDSVTGESLATQVGDKLVVDANENVWFVRDGVSHLVLERDGTLHPLSHDEFPLMSTGPVDQPESPVASMPAPEAFGTTEAAPQIPEVSMPEEEVAEVEAAVPEAIVGPDQSIEAPVVAAPSAPEPVPEASTPEEVPVPSETIDTPRAAVEATPEDVNAHGVNLHEPGIALVDGEYFAHGGAGNEQNYNLAVEHAREIARTEPGTPVYYVEEYITVLGGLEQKVRAVVFDPAGNNGAGIVVPYVSDGGLAIEMPGVPNPDDYRPLPNTR